MEKVKRNNIIMTIKCDNYSNCNYIVSRLKRMKKFRPYWILDEVKSFKDEELNNKIFFLNTDSKLTHDKVFIYLLMQSRKRNVSFIIPFVNEYIEQRIKYMSTYYLNQIHHAPDNKYDQLRFVFGEEDLFELHNLMTGDNTYLYKKKEKLDVSST